MLVLLIYFLLPVAVLQFSPVGAAAWSFFNQTTSLLSKQLRTNTRNTNLISKSAVAKSIWITEVESLIAENKKNSTKMNWKVVFALLFVFVTLIYRASSSNIKGRRFRVNFLLSPSCSVAVLHVYQ